MPSVWLLCQPAYWLSLFFVLCSSFDQHVLGSIDPGIAVLPAAAAGEAPDFHSAVFISACRARLPRVTSTEQDLKPGNRARESQHQGYCRAGRTSVSTVSRALNNSGYVSPDVRTRVEEAVRDLNYTPSKDARMLRGAPSRVIGLMLPAVDVPFFGMLAQAIEQALFQKDYQTLICCTSENLEHEARYVSMLLSQRVDGVIVAMRLGMTRISRLSGRQMFRWWPSTVILPALPIMLSRQIIRPVAG